MCINFAKYADKIALIHDKSYTYGEILSAINSAKLTKIPQNSVVCLKGDYSLNFIAFLFALCAKKCIIAPMLPKNMDFELSEFGVEFVLNLENNEISKLDKATPHRLLSTLKKQNKSGLILFSSGSTGRPKAVVHDLDAFLQGYGEKKFNPTRTISTFLPDHIAGLDVLFSVFGTGGVLIIPKTRTPQDILQALQDHKVEIFPASPSLLRLLTLFNIENFELNSLKLIVHGSEKMPEILLKNLQKALPNARFKQSFGTSETNALKTKNLAAGSDFFKFIGVDYKIVENELFIKAKSHLLGYLNTQNSALDEDGYFATGDLVELLMINGEEFIRILGRTKELINVGGEKVLPQEVEGIIMQMPFISDCLVFGEQNAITGQSVSAKIVLDTKNPAFKENFGGNLQNLGGNSTQNLALNSSENSQNLGENFASNLSSKNLPQISNLELKKQIRAFCKDKLANFKIPTKVEIVENLAVSERFKKVRKI